MALLGEGSWKRACGLLLTLHHVPCPSVGGMNRTVCGAVQGVPEALLENRHLGDPRHSDTDASSRACSHSSTEGSRFMIKSTSVTGNKKVHFLCASKHSACISIHRSHSNVNIHLIFDLTILLLKMDGDLRAVSH